MLKTATKSEYFFRFKNTENLGWNSVFAFTLSGAKRIAKQEFEPKYKPDYTTFKKLDDSTRTEYHMLLSLFN